MIVRLMLFFAVFAISLDAYAQTGSGSSAASPVLVGPLIWGLICFITRKRAIGGWLLYFYAGLLGGGIFMLVSLAAVHWGALAPHTGLARLATTYFFSYTRYRAR